MYLQQIQRQEHILYKSDKYDILKSVFIKDKGIYGMYPLYRISGKEGIFMRCSYKKKMYVNVGMVFILKSRKRFLKRHSG